MLSFFRGLQAYRLLLFPAERGPKLQHKCWLHEIGSLGRLRSPLLLNSTYSLDI